MNQLLSRILDAHGGMDRWRDLEKVEATIVAGGGFYPLKGMTNDATPRRLTAWLHEERSSVLPFGAPDQRTMFTPERIAIEKLDGTTIAERPVPKTHLVGTRCTHRGTRSIELISTEKLCGLIQRHPFSSRSMGCGSRKRSLGRRGQ